MDFLWRLHPLARLAILVCLSLCIHLLILFVLPSPALGTRGIQPAANTLTVILLEAPVAADIAEPPRPQESPKPSRAKPGNKFALSSDGLSLAVDLHYFSLEELDRRPYVIDDIPPNPPELLDFPQGGKLVMRLWIDESGKVVNAEPVSSELPPAFVESARRNFMTARFAPGRKMGRPVPSVIDAAVIYRPN